MESLDIIQKVSIIVPCRNEKGFIDKCMRSIVNNDFPKDKLEVLVVDGMSDDGTRDIIKQYSANYPIFKLLDNPRQIVSSALNEGIKNAGGEIIMRMDVHCVYNKDYISQCVKYLQKFDVDNVGGICITMPGKDTAIAHSIAFAMSHPFGVGNSYFRIGSKELRYVDTVTFGCFKREVFEKIGVFDEELLRNQDDEFNLRLIKNGGKILLVPEIVSYYFARDSLLKLWNMYFQYGYFKPLVVKKIGAILTWRQLLPPIFVCSLFVSGTFSLIKKETGYFFFMLVLLYSLTSILVSSCIAIKKGIKNIYLLPCVFATMHFSYGIGYLKGILDFIIRKKSSLGKSNDLKLSR